MTEQSETTENQQNSKKEARQPENQSVQGTENPEQYTQESQPETQGQPPQTEPQSSAPETGNEQTEMRSTESETPAHDAQSVEPETVNREPETEYQEPETEIPQQAAQEIEFERESQNQAVQAQPQSESQTIIPDQPPSQDEQPQTQQPEEIAPPEPLQPEPGTQDSFESKPSASQPESSKAGNGQITQEKSPEPEPEQTKTRDNEPETKDRPPENDDPEVSDDEDILKFIEETKQKIFIVGAGGSGCNTLDRLFQLGTTGASLVAMNTDAKHLLKTRANRKIILGKKISRGRGAGSNPAIGEKAAKESAEEIQHAIGDGSLVFITCGLGGGTGTGSAPVIAEAAKSAGALTVAVVTLPFSSEGKIRMDNALQGMDRLRKHTDTLIVIKNDKLLNLVPDLPLNTAFKVCDEVLAGSVKGIAELVTKSGLVNVDFADLRTILTSAGFAAIGLGEASLDAKQEDRARVAVETAISSPLLDADISSSTRALINVIGGEDMTLKEAEFIVAETSRRINPNAHIIWGARIEENIKKSSMRVLVVLAGVKFPKYAYQPKDTGVDELDLDLIG